MNALVQREHELAALDNALALATGGEAVVVALAGEPGIGKTRLLGELRERAQAAGCAVFSGRAAEFERDEPFGVFVSALDSHVKASERQLVRRLGREAMGDLASVLPGLEALGYEPASLLGSERFRAHRAMRALLEALAAERTLVLVLDDLHWADDASLELLGALVHRRPRGRVLLACALRPRRAPRRLVEALADEVVRLELGPLDAEAIRAMLDGDVDEPTVEMLHRESGGVPFYLEELARAVREERAPARWSEGPDVPRAVAQALAGEIEALGDPARRLLQGAAVAGDPFDPAVAAAAAGAEEAEALPLLDELVAADLVRETDVPRRLRFRHPIVRSAVYESAGPGWRLAAHGRAAAALAAAGASPVARAHHIAAAARPGDEEAVRLLGEAAQAVASRAPAVAAHWFGEALRLLPAGHDLWRLGLLGMRAGSLAAAGRLDESREALLEAIALAPAAGDPIRVRLTTGCAWIELLLGRPAQAEARLLALLDELGDPHSPEAALVDTELAAVRLFTGDFERSMAPARRAKEAADAHGDQMLGATATVLLGCGDLSLGRMDAALAALDEAGAVVDACDDEALAARIDAPPFYLGHLAQWAERYADGVRWFERGIAVARLSGYGHVLVTLMTGKAHALATLGRLDAADTLATAAVDGARLSANSHDLAWALWVRSWVSLNLGDLRDAVRAGEESVGLVRRLDHSNACIGAGWALGSALLEAGDPAHAAEVLLEVGGGPALPLLAPVARCISYEVLTRSALAREAVDEGAEWASRAEETAVGLGTGFAAGVVRRARAAVQLASGEASAAADTALDAAACAERPGARIEAARARILAGRALIAAGQRERAAVELEAARTELAACGARRWADEAAHELRALGHRVARGGEPSRGAGPGALSRREREVAELVAAGRTNKEIAAALYITENTVESHMRRVFAKLDVSKRAALAATLAAERPDSRPAGRPGRSHSRFSPSRALLPPAREPD